MYTMERHRWGAWRENDPRKMMHLADPVRFCMGRAVITYFRVIYRLQDQRLEQQPEMELAEFQDESEMVNYVMEVDQEESDDASKSDTHSESSNSEQTYSETSRSMTLESSDTASPVNLNYSSLDEGESTSVDCEE